jgi:LacI family transcriptional regulator
MSKRASAPTMKEVAELARVSVQTVSLVVNNRPEITEETRARVQAAIDELGYQPHAGAQSLRSGQTGIIGLLMPDANNPHFWDIVGGVEEAAIEHGYRLLLATTALSPERERSSFQALAQQRIDGLILMLTFPELFEEELASLKRQGKPMVSTGRISPGLDAVNANYDDGAQQMMDHLLSLGHRRIALIHGVGRPSLASERVEAHQRCLRAAGIPLEEALIAHCGPSLEEGFAAAERLLDLSPRPTAILGINDIMAMSALQASLRRGLRVPEDISIAGFDDIAMAAFLAPALTTVRVNGAEEGRQMARLLFERLTDPQLPPREVQIPVQLVIRGSTGPAR